MSSPQAPDVPPRARFWFEIIHQIAFPNNCMRIDLPPPDRGGGLVWGVWVFFVVVVTAVVFNKRMKATQAVLLTFRDAEGKPAL